MTDVEAVWDGAAPPGPPGHGAGRRQAAVASLAAAAAVHAAVATLLALQPGGATGHGEPGDPAAGAATAARVRLITEPLPEAGRESALAAADPDAATPPSRADAPIEAGNGPTIDSAMSREAAPAALTMDLRQPGPPATTEDPHAATVPDAGVARAAMPPPAAASSAPAAAPTPKAPEAPVGPQGPTPADPRWAQAVDGYLPRRVLTVGPVPRREVPLAWPSGWDSRTRQSGIFTLFIDEAGVVRRMVADGPTLMAGLERAARDAFLSVPFAPGELDGQPVKSIIRIEVVFSESTPRAPRAQDERGPPVVTRRPL